MPEYIRETVGAALAIAALGVVSYVAVVGGNQDALIALVAILNFAGGYYLRGRVSNPNP